MSIARALLALLCFAGAMAAGLWVLWTFAGTSVDDTAAMAAYQVAVDRSGHAVFHGQYAAQIAFPDGQTQDASVTIIFDGRATLRLDVTAAGSDATVTTLTSTDRVFTCRGWRSQRLAGHCSSGLAGGSNRAGAEHDAGSFTLYVLASAGLVRSGVHVSPRGTRTIAGHAAHCFLWFAARPSASSEECYGDRGEPLYLDFASRHGGILMRATDVSSDVTDADFAPPYPVIRQ